MSKLSPFEAAVQYHINCEDVIDESIRRMRQSEKKEWLPPYQPGGYANTSSSPEPGE